MILLLVVTLNLPCNTVRIKYALRIVRICAGYWYILRSYSAVMNGSTHPILCYTLEKSYVMSVPHTNDALSMEMNTDQATSLYEQRIYSLKASFPKTLSYVISPSFFWNRE